MVFNGIFNNILAISWRSVLLMEETRVPGENHQPATSHIMLHRVHLSWTGFEFPTLVVIGTHCIGSYKSNYHTITTTTAADVSINYRSIDPLHIPDLFLKLYVFIGVYFHLWRAGKMVHVLRSSTERTKKKMARIFL